MKLTKKVLVLALAASTILLTACDNGSGREPSGNGGGSGGNGEFVSPTLPERKGTNPFAGLVTLTTDNQKVRYLVDTEKKALTEQSLAADGTTWSPTAEYSYSYDGTVTPPTVTGRFEAEYDKEGRRLTPADSWAAFEAEWKKSFTEAFGKVFDSISAITDPTTKQAEIDTQVNKIVGLPLTADDFTPAKKDATMEKVCNSKAYQDAIKAEKEIFKKRLSMTPTYTVTLTERSGASAKIAVEGQYDSTLQWYEQQAGSFGGSSSDNTIHAEFQNEFGLIGGSSTNYISSAFTASSISFVDANGTTKTFSYTTTGSGASTVVTVNMEGKEVTCTWTPSTAIGNVVIKR